MLYFSLFKERFHLHPSAQCNSEKVPKLFVVGVLKTLIFSFITMMTTASSFLCSVYISQFFSPLDKVCLFHVLIDE